MRQSSAAAVIALTLAALVAVGVSRGETAPRIVVFSKTDLVPRGEPLLVGAAVHFGVGGEYNYNPPRTAAALKELGIPWFRDDLPWSSFSRGTPDHPEPKKLFYFLALQAAHPLLILGSPNPAVPNGDPPMGPGVAAFADFVTQAVTATRAYNPIYEVWNEWNMNAVRGQPWLVGPGEPTDPRAVANYAPLAKAAVAAIRMASPSSPILVGAVGIDQGWQWTKALVDSGALEGATGLSVHLYNHCEADTAKRTATEAIDRVSQLEQMVSPDASKPMPIYVTEFGWPTAKRQCVIAPEVEADNIAQFLLWSAATPWLKGAWVYQLKDQGLDPDEMEHNFGLVNYTYEPKPAACAMREAISLVSAADSFALTRPSPDVFTLQLPSPTGLRIVAWTTAGAPEATLSLPAEVTFAAKSLCRDTATSDGHTVRFGSEPVVIDVEGVDHLSGTIT